MGVAKWGGLTAFIGNYSSIPKENITLSEGSIIVNGLILQRDGDPDFDDSVDAFTSAVNSGDFEVQIGGKTLSLKSSGKPDTGGGGDGDQGIKGNQGLKGAKGDRGEKGEDGNQGIKGDQGLKGGKRIKGEKGEDGYQGIK